MTEEQLENFFKKRGELEIVKIKAIAMLDSYGDEDLKNNLSCDHKYSDGKLAGPEFQGSYCGFICKICGCSVSYERMGF